MKEINSTGKIKRRLFDRNEANLTRVDTRKLLGKLPSVKGLGLRVGQQKTAALGSTAHGVQSLNIANGASQSEMAHAIFAAAFANNIASDDAAKDAACKAALEVQGHQARGLLENMAANWLSSSGGRWNQTTLSKQKFLQLTFEAAVKGSQAYVSRQEGNTYTDYLRGRYGQWGDEQDAMAVHLITNPDSSELTVSEKIGPATADLVSSGIPVGQASSAAMQNMAVQAMHPARRKKAVLAALSYTFQNAKALYGRESNSVFDLAHGEMARTLSSDEVHNALQMYQISGEEELNSTMAPEFMDATAALANATGKDFSTAYTCLATAAQYHARSFGYIRQTEDLSSISSFSDLSAVIVPAEGQSHSQAIQNIIEAASKILATMESHKIPMQTVLNEAVAEEVFQSLANLAPCGLQSSEGSRVFNVVACNLSTLGAEHTHRTIEAMYQYQANGGKLDKLDKQRIILATRLYEQLGSAGVSPHVVEVMANDPNNSIQFENLDKVAMYYQTGLVTDYRLAGVVGQLVANKIQVNRQNIQLAVESMASNAGQMDSNYMRAVILLGIEATKSASSAPKVLEIYARAVAANEPSLGADKAAKMNLAHLLCELEKVSQNYSASNLTLQIVQMSRAAGRFSDQQLLDPAIVQMIVERGNSHPYAAQAIKVISTIVDSAEAMNHPEYINVVAEFLDNGGKMTDVNIGTLHAAVALGQARFKGMSGQTAQWNSVKICPQALNAIQRDPDFSLQNNSLSDSLIDEILSVN